VLKGIDSTRRADHCCSAARRAHGAWTMARQALRSRPNDESQNEVLACVIHDLVDARQNRFGRAMPSASAAFKLTTTSNRRGRLDRQRPVRWL